MQTDNENSKKRKAELVLLQISKSPVMKVLVNGVPVTAIIDSGATMSVIARKFVPASAMIPSNAIPIQVGNGQTIWTEGTAEIVVSCGETTIVQPAVVLDTDAFQAVLGMDFLQSPHCGGLLTQGPRAPCKILLDGKAHILEEANINVHNYRLFRLFKKESYTLIPEPKSQAFSHFGISSDQIHIDTFANHKNAQYPLFCTRKNDAFAYDWSLLVDPVDSLPSASAPDFLWANPPFSILDLVVTKLILEPTRMILVTPHWPSCAWHNFLEQISVQQFFIPVGTPVYKDDFSDKCLPPLHGQPLSPL